MILLLFVVLFDIVFARFINEEFIIVAASTSEFVASQAIRENTGPLNFSFSRQQRIDVAALNPFGQVRPIIEAFFSKFHFYFSIRKVT
jgi:hypothetical protein